MRWGLGVWKGGVQIHWQRYDRNVYRFPRPKSFPMMQAVKKIFLTEHTGDPFADTGGFVIKTLWDQPHLKNRTILELIEYVTKIYVKRWKGNVHALFLNSPITQRGGMAKRIRSTMEYYESLIEETAPFVEGYCRISGRKTRLFSAGRHNHILSGSEKFINFHHSFERGILLSKEILIRMYFVPLGVILVGEKLALVQSNRKELSEYFVRELLVGTDGHLRSLELISDGIRRHPYGKPSTALFSFARKCVEDFSIVPQGDDGRDVSIMLYHFSNFAMDPNINLHVLPAPVFSFVARCITGPIYKNDWERFINSNYVKYIGSSSNFDAKEQRYFERSTEAVRISRNVYDSLRKDKRANFFAANAGTISVNGVQMVLVHKSEYDYWKKGRGGKEFQKASNHKSVSLIRKTRSIKGDFVFTYDIDDYQKRWINLIYERLLAGQSILPYVVSYMRKYYKEHGFNFKIVRLYALNILNMKSQTLDVIEKLAWAVIEYSDNLKRDINRYLSTSRYDVLRSFVIRLVKLHHSKGSVDPLLSADEYVKYLFGEGGNWKEMRDLLLICTYQRLHERRLFFDENDDEEFEVDYVDQISNESD